MVKYFGIGLSRTATQSLTDAFTLMGFRAKHFLTNGAYNRIRRKYDFCADFPIASRFKELDLKYPGSKFIYTIRDMDSWLESCRIHFAKKPCFRDYQREYRRAAYGCVNFYKDKFKVAYKRHDKDVRDYFKDRPNDLLIMDICNGDGWNKLIPFIGEENIINKDFVKTDSFPHSNVGSIYGGRRTWKVVGVE